MSRQEYWELCPEGFVHPLESAKHAPFLRHYGRVRTFDDWVSTGFEISHDKLGRITQRKGRNLHRFSRVLTPGPSEQEAIVTGKRNIYHFYPMLEYVRAGVPFDDFVSHPQHFRDFCLGSLAQEAGNLREATDLFRQALAADPGEVRYAEKFYRLRVADGDISAPAQELDYFANSADSMVHSGRVDEWIKLLLKHKDCSEAARLLRRVAELLEAKIAGRLPKGQYSGDSVSFAAYKRDQFRKKLSSWANSKKYAPLMSEIERQGGLPELLAAPE